MGKTVNCIAFDLGASGGKVIIGAYANGKITLNEVYRFPNTPILLGDHTHWDFLHMLQEVKKGLQSAIKELNGDAASLGVDTWGDDCAFLDKHDHLLGNPFSYRDPRTNGMMERAFQKMPRTEIFARTGVQFMQINTLFQLLSMVEEDPKALDPVGTYLMIPDLFNFYLTGIKGCEFTNATTTQFYNPYTLEWDKPILQAMGIPIGIFPEVIQPGTRIGTLAPWICEELEIKSVPVMAVGTHDTPSAVSAVPAERKDYAFLSSGTWSLLGAEEDAPIVNDLGLKNNFSNYGGVCGKWLVWKNIQALWLLQECMRHWAGVGKKYTHEDMILMANEAKPFGPIIDTDDLLFFTSGDFPTRITEFCQRTDQTPPEGDGAIARCILESLALKYRFTFEKLQEVIGKKLNQIHVIGGGSRNWLLNKFTAEAIGVPVKAGPVEASSIGNLMMQLMALGEMDCLDSCRQVIQSSFETAIFESCRTNAWEDAYGKYLGVIQKSRTFNQ